MRREGHLEVYDLILTTRSPLHVGSGTAYKKFDYLFDAAAKKVRILDLDRLFQLLIDRDLADAYERFALGGGSNLRSFLTRECRLTDAELNSLTRYSLNTGDALDAEHSLKEIRAFQRRGDGRAYVPGSSVKGALRTVFLAERMAQKKPSALYRKQEDRKGRKMTQVEGEYLNTLHLKQNRKTGQWENDPVNSMFRGISVSDSEPIPDKAMILCGKFDAWVSGGWHQLNLCRECVRPGTELRFRLTLDQSVLKGSVTREGLLNQLQWFAQYYLEHYLSRFDTPRDAVAERYQNCLFLGGGVGFFSKTVVYPTLGDEEGLHFTAEEMMTQFPRHGHEWDESDYEASPHIVKYAKYGGKLYHYGVCGVSLQ